MQDIEVDMARMKQAVEAACRSTTVTTITIDHDALDAKFFAAGEPKASRLVIRLAMLLTRPFAMTRPLQV